MDMSVSKKDKMLLCVVGALAVGVAYYSFVYTPMCDDVTAKKAEKVQIEQKYDKAMADIASLESRKSDVKLLVGKSTEKSARFYPTIIQEKLIDEIDTLAKAAELKITARIFTEKELGPVEQFVLTDKTLGDGTLGDLVNKYKGKAATNSNTSASSATTTQKTDGTTCQQIKATLTINTSERSIEKFLQSLEQNSKRINVTGIVLQPKSESEVSGTINIEFYAVPKIDTSDDAYVSTWTYNNVYGKTSLFSKEAASGPSNATIEDATAEKKSDFTASLKAPNSSSGIPLTLGKANDDLLATYIYGRSNKMEAVEVTFTEENGKLYYQYKTESSRYPDSTKGKEFTPYGSAIEFLILSEARTGSDDTSGINLKVINKTSKQVNITVKGDDTVNPRVPAPSTEGSVSVVNK